MLLCIFYSLRCWRPYSHAEALQLSVASIIRDFFYAHLGKGRNLLVAVRVEILLGIINGHSSVDSIWQSSILHNGHALIAAIRMFEEHGSRPVVTNLC